MLKSSSTRCRKGSCTSRQCSRAKTASSTRTCGADNRGRSAGQSTATVPSGEAHESTDVVAMPLKPARCAGPSITTRLIVPRRLASGA